MEGLNYGGPPLSGNYQALFQTLGPQIVLIHHRQDLEETQCLIRFVNGYGVAVLPVFPAEDDPAWEMLVLRFRGPKINDYELVQYGPLPEYHRGDFHEIMDLCRQVSRLPQSRTLTYRLPSSAVRNKKREEEKRCSNF
ncbi:MAG: hypothetical protein AB1424_17195 [Thermodesulfobacteriota bacterium]